MQKSSMAAGGSRSRSVDPCILLVDDEPAMIELLEDVVSRDLRCRVVTARTLHEARRALSRENVSLMLADVRLPDGNGADLVEELRQHNTSAKAIVMTGDPSVEIAIQAMRHGAVDFVPKPFSARQIADRVQSAIHQQVADARSRRRLERLRVAVRRLSEARKIVGRQVDLLCNDLIGAYGDLARRFNDTRCQEDFRKYIEGSCDLEQLLCHAMDWMLRQIGYANVAIWLACDDVQFQLGAYMKYTIPGEPELMDAMRSGLARQTVGKGQLLWNRGDAPYPVSDAEAKYLADQSILSTHCTYLGESLAVVTLFRNAGDGFTEEHAELMRKISPLFAIALTERARSASSSTSDLGSPEDEYSADGQDDEDSADWWKRGERPPF